MHFKWYWHVLYLIKNPLIIIKFILGPTYDSNNAIVTFSKLYLLNLLWNEHQKRKTETGLNERDHSVIVKNK